MGIGRSLTGPEVHLKDILDNREKRAARQRALLASFGAPLVSFSMNIAGPVKRFPLADRAYRVGKDELTALLSGKHWPIRFFEEAQSNCGLECIWVVDAPPEALKAGLAALEETHPLGRLFDLDVIDPGGSKIQRTETGFPERGCIVCAKAGMGCARSRAHDIEDLQRATQIILERYFDGAFCDTLSELAVKALLYEVSVSPKPGLVDRLSSGAHRDMDFYTFLDSACALSHYFREISGTTLRLAHFEASQLLHFLSHAGLKAERAMNEATGGINTHKGAIYAVGILCAAYAYAYANQLDMSLDHIFALCAQIAAPGMAGICQGPSATAGQQIYRAHGIPGARGEAAGGFPSVRETGLPVYQRCLREGFSHNDAGVITLLNLIAVMDDTNAIKRVGLEKARQMRDAVKSALETLPDGELLNFAQTLDADYTQHRVSHGGAADMLGLTIAALMMDEWVHTDEFTGM